MSNRASYVLDAARAGLLPRPGRFQELLEAPLPLPEELFEKRGYVIRHPVGDDLPALVRLEEACWPAPLRMTVETLRHRVEHTPREHCVLVVEGRVLGVIYAQRILDTPSLLSTTSTDVWRLHGPGRPVVQLLALNVLPEAQSQGLGDPLLEFMLQWCTVRPDVERVVAVTLCRDYERHSDVPLELYIQQREASGLPRDPILRLHASHGAAIRGLVPGYRPGDVSNLGHGVLVEYDLRHRLESLHPAPALADAPVSMAWSLEAVSAAIADSVREVLGERAREFTSTRAWADLGLDSLDLHGLRAHLGQQLGASLDVTSFFRFGTPLTLAEMLHRAASGGRVAEPTGPARSSPVAEADRLTSRAGPERRGEPHDEPVAIIGMAVRLPGQVDGLERYWQVLRDGVDAITEIPRERWDVERFYAPDRDTPGKMVSRYGGFLEGVDRFDARFFGISPREAAAMDPQQRLLLEVTWEALERAGIAPGSLAGSATGVFVGISTHDYELLQVRAGRYQELDIHFATGNAPSIAAGRVAYALGLQGPALSIDTACSSSLVAVHAACQSLRTSESHLALASGVNLLLSPELSITFSNAGMLAADGRCKTFDSAADGYVRSEGCGVVVLKRLADALADRDPILAVIRGSAIRQDGASNGLTAPNGLSQEAVIRGALAMAGVRPDEVSYVEAHGTGTSLGDPIEVKALANVYGEGRSRTSPLRIGSVKTNLGHTEAVAGLAGLGKVVLSLQHERIPAHLHLEEPNPLLQLSTLPVEITREGADWPRDPERRRLAGLSSFGFSGTNAHLVLEEPPLVPSAPATEDRAHHLLVLSARDELALRELAGRYQRHLDSQPASLADVCFTAGAGRDHFAHRLAVVGSTAAEVSAQLGEFSRTGQHEEAPVPGPVLARKAGRDRAKVAFLFTGQGSQYAGMGQQLFQTQKTFRSALEHCDALLRPLLERPLLEVLFPLDGPSPLLHETLYTQPALFAFEYALAQLWRSWGIEPDVVLGHSVGEYAAACVAGVFSLEDGLKLIATRARLMHALPPGGAMVAVLAEAARVQEALASAGSDVAIAAVNGPKSVVISGLEAAVEVLVRDFTARGITSRRLQVSHAFHSPLMDPVLDPFEQAAATLTLSPPRIPLVSNLTGALASAELTRPSYWREHVRQPVRFMAGMEALGRLGCELFLEVGPQPVLIQLGRTCLPEPHRRWLPSVRPGIPDWEPMLRGLGEFYVRGADIPWARLDEESRRHKVPLPTYPFQRERFWFTRKGPSEDARTGARGTGRASHSLLGRLVRSAVPREERIFESVLSSHALPLLEDHRVFSVPVAPAAAYLEMALAAGRIHLGAQALEVEDLTVQQALVLQEQQRTVQLVLQPTGEGSTSFQVFSLDGDGTEGGGEDAGNWVLHASGRLRTGEAASETPRVDVPALRARLSENVSVEQYYAQCSARGIDYGPAFRAVEALWRKPDEVLGRIRLPAVLEDADEAGRRTVLLDAAFQVVGAALPRDAEEITYLPVGLERMRLSGPLEQSLWCHARLRTAGGREAFSADILLVDSTGLVVASLEGFALKRAARGAVRPSEPEWRRWLYQVEWRPQDRRPIPQEPGGLLSPAELDARLSAEAAMASTAEGRALAPLAQRMEALCATFSLQALLQLGWKGEPERPFTRDELATTLGIVPRHYRLLGALLSLLTEEGLLARQGEGWVARVPPVSTDAAVETAALLRDFPQASTELEVLSRCGNNLAGVLRGDVQPLQLLFPEADTSTLTRLYQEAPTFRGMNALVERTVRLALSRLPPGRPLRVLEIGAGTGSITARLLPLLPADQTTYVFTDVSTLFTSRAAERFSAFPFVQYKLLDIESAPGAQGFQPHTYDLVLAANVLHATAELRQTLRHVLQLLAPGGELVLLEGTSKRRWIDLIFGLTEGWWRFQDPELRGSHPLLSAPRWTALLEEEGFEQPVALSLEDAVLFPQSVLIARAPSLGAQADVARRWLILAESSGTGRALAERLRARGQSCTLALPGPEYAQVDAETFSVSPERPDDMRQLLRTLGPQALRGVVHLWSLEAADLRSLTPESLEAASRQSCGSALHLVQALLEAEPTQPPALWLVTRGASAAGPVPELPGIAQAPLAGLAKVIAMEHPELRCAWVDLDPRASESSGADELAGELLAEEGESQVAFRGPSRFTARLVPSRQPWSPEGTPRFLPDAAYLITGGSGGLGLLVARWLVERGARHLVLLGRRDMGQLQSDVSELVRAGARIDLVRADVSDAAACREVVARLTREGISLRGVIHSAGVLEDGALRQQTWARFASVLAPKVQGAFNLHEATRDQPLDFFVLFSSTASLIGSAGQANHSAANAFLDALAHARRAQGLPALSINWGAWSEVGAAARKQVSERWRVKGIGTIAPEQGLAALAHFFLQGASQVGIAPIDWPRFLSQHAPSRFFSEMTPTTAREEPEARGEALRRIQTAAAHEQRDLLKHHVQVQVAKVLGWSSSDQLPSEQGFFQLGMDSLTSVELRNRLQASLGCKLAATLVFDHPTVDALASHLAERVLAMKEPSTPDPRRSPEPREDAGQLALESLSQDELAALLTSKLASMEQGG
ncbi:type I polyketide synthase [Corallococcus sp. Z5C101001]|uniref:type I polyketide synthase n=1 Tax=Corallococcus sp. Z5C101001 TaxID=2596829 RepID=UPI00117E8D63|nr:type I polyketide synthase [Corallococcus sp. Z5C101001]TSC24500.1 SDR family NAD(P)-dependent oxidoreductase [Corallococcus sp. Z5C101001]